MRTSFFTTFVDQGSLNTAHMLSAAPGPSLECVTALPGAPPTHFSHGDFVLAGRQLFSLGVAITIATQPHQCMCVIDAELLDHVVICK